MVSHPTRDPFTLVARRAMRSSTVPTGSSFVWRKQRVRQIPVFVAKTMSELAVLRHFFLTLDTELESIIEAEDVLTQAESPWIPTYDQLVADRAAHDDDPADGQEDLWADQYWD